VPDRTLVLPGHLLPFFDAPAYTLAYLLVISALACTR